MTGAITFQTDFHDTGSGPRVPSMNDHFGFTMAALDENGSVFANPCKGEKNTSTLMYRPFGSWANNSEVRMFSIIVYKYLSFILLMQPLYSFIYLCICYDYKSMLTRISSVKNQWSMRFDGEEVKVVAIGSKWVAAFTSLNYLRIFTDGGLQVCWVDFLTSAYLQPMHFFSP